jgi:hypothetical protein
MRRLPLLSAVLFLASLFSAGTWPLPSNAQTPRDYSDTELRSEGWTEQWQSGEPAESEHPDAGGNLGPHLLLRYPNPSGRQGAPSTIRSSWWYTRLPYHDYWPEREGAIACIDFAIDVRLISGLGHEHVGGMYLMEGGRTFIAPETFTNLPTTWTRLDRRRLGAESFIEFKRSGLPDVWTILPDENPDFSDTSEQTFFGFFWLTRNHSEEPVTYEIGIDNWRVRVNNCFTPLTPTPGTPPLPAVTASPRPPVTPTPVPTASDACVCDLLHSRVPAAAIDHAVANPGRYPGWLQRLDPGKPPGPANPLRTCLTLKNRGMAFHALFNGLEWRAGCP